MYKVNQLWQIDICMLEIFWRWVWNSEIGAFLALQSVFMKFFLWALYKTRYQWPSVSKIKYNFLSKFCLIFLLILSLNDSIFTGYYRLLNNDNIIFGFCSNFTSFRYTLEKIGNSFQMCSKNLQNHSKPINFMKPVVIPSAWVIGSESREKIGKI